MVLDHINGISDDNRIENLRYVCPNCNSQLPTTGSKNKNRMSSRKEKENKCYDCGKKIKNGKRCIECSNFSKRKVNRPSKEELIKEISETSYVAVGKKYGVSDNAIRKWLK